MHKLFVYGTLRPKSGVTVKVPGKLYDLGWFPGCKLIPDGDAEFDCEILEVDDAGLRRADQYEGYLEDHIVTGKHEDKEDGSPCDQAANVTCHACGP